MQLAYGRNADLHYRLENCDVVVSLDDDLLGPGPRQVFHARAWAGRRGEAENRSRLHLAESTPSLTGTVATTCLPADASRIGSLALALGAHLGVDGMVAPDLSEAERRWVDAAATDLQNHAGRCLFAAGSHLPAWLQALAASVNDKLGNTGQTLWTSEPVAFAEGDSIAGLARDIESGAVDTLVVLDANPVYAAPPALRLVDLLPRVRERIHIGLYRDETAELCRWHLPLAHMLESWSDARAIDGTTTIIQPLVTPLYSARNSHQMVDMLLGTIDPAADAAVRATWMQTFGASFDGKWRQSLHDGFVADTAAQPLSLQAQAPALPTL